LTTQEVFFNSGGNIGPSGTIFLTSNGAQAVEPSAQLLMTYNGTLNNLYAVLGTGPGEGGLATFTVRVNGVDTALSVSMTSTTTFASDTVDQVPVVTGNLVSLQLVTNSINPTYAIASFDKTKT
jgi:hypothetical protein